MLIKKRKNQKAFTLVELLIVIAILAILAGIVMVALNPLARFQDSRNARRWTDVNAILDAITLQQVDNKGIYDDVILDLDVGSYYQIGADDAGACADTCSNPTISLEDDCVDLDNYISGEYLQEIPMDPNDPDASDDKTKYYLIRNDNGSVTVGSCSEELGSNSSIPNISVTK